LEGCGVKNRGEWGKRRSSGPRPGGKQSKGSYQDPGAIGLARIEGCPDAFELVHPRCVAEAELDYQEGIELWKAGDPEEARDALRYALGACRDNLWVHVALGKLALEEFKDPALARGHFGYAVELGRKALPPDFAGRLPRERDANKPFFEGIEGLAECLRISGKSPDAEDLTSLARRLAAGSASRSV
jgi:tetratricopeptide (TPR) repeat protein